mgnify:CR=1 FL=1
MNSKKIAANLLFGIGALIILVTHIQILAMGLPTQFHTFHAIINIFAGALTMTGFLMIKK